MEEVSYNTTYNATDDYEYYYASTELDFSCWTLRIPDALCHNPSFVIVCLGYIYPFIAIFTTLANVFSFIVFTRYSYSATWMILAGIALADIMTALPPTGHYMYLFTFGNFRHSMHFVWCTSYFLVVEFLPLWFHTASILLTVMLCIQRYVFIYHPLHIKVHHSTKRNIFIIITAFLLAFLAHFHILIRLKSRTEEIDFVNATDNNSTYKDLSCNWSIDIGSTHETIHNVIYVIFIELIPCVLITAMTIKMVRKLQKSRTFYVHTATKDVHHHEASDGQSSTRQTTIMLVCIMILFMVAEIPYIIFLLFITAKRYIPNLFSNDKLYMMIVVQTLIVLLNCHLNFWIYCIVSKKMFRKSLKELCFCKKDEPENATSNFAELHPLTEKTPDHFPE